MTNEQTSRMVHTITFWIVITDNMRRFGYRDIEPIFHRPFELDDSDECREYQAVVPADYVISQGENLVYKLWDKTHDMAAIAAEVDKGEIELTTTPLYDDGKRGPVNHYPIRLIRNKY